MSYEKDIFQFSLEKYDPAPVQMKSYWFRRRTIYLMNQKCREFDLHPQTLFIAISLFDKLVEKDSDIFMYKGTEFISTILLWISSKFEEIYPLCFRDLFYMTEHKKSKEDFLEFEKCVLQTIKYKIPHVTSYSILEQYKNIYPLLQKKDIFKKCLKTLLKKTFEENISSLSVLELIRFELNKFSHK